MKSPILPKQNRAYIHTVKSADTLLKMWCDDVLILLRLGSLFPQFHFFHLVTPFTL